MQNNLNKPKTLSNLAVYTIHLRNRNFLSYPAGVIGGLSNSLL